MKKVKMIVGASALIVATTTAFAFVRANKLPGNLYWFDSSNTCVLGWCETTNNTGIKCAAQELANLYTDSQCSARFDGQAWETEN
jgi:hypothetical protein